MALVTRFTELVGCRHPIQQAGIGGMTSADLAVAVGQAGGLGMLTGTVGQERLDAQLASVPPGVAVGVNFLVPFLDPGALESASSRRSFVEFFWGEPDSDLVEIASAGGSVVSWQVGSADEGRAAQDAGSDVIVAQGVEAGGHVRGTVGLLPLLDELRAVVELPIIAAGGIGTDRAMAAVLVAGADAVRVGTRFMAAYESTAHPVYVDALVASTAADTVVTTVFGDGWPDAPHRVLRSAVSSGNDLGQAQTWTPDWPTSSSRGPVEARAMYAGQSVGAVRGRQSAADIVDELAGGAERLLSAARH